MIVNFKTREINQGIHKLVRTFTLIKKKNANNTCTTWNVARIAFAQLKSFFSGELIHPLKSQHLYFIKNL